MANDGTGMNPREHLRTLQSCLRGTKEKIHRLACMKHKVSGVVEEDPDRVFEEIKQRHMRFIETLMEKQTRVSTEWDRLWKGNKTAYQFKAEVEEHRTELELAGLAKN